MIYPRIGDVRFCPVCDRCRCDVRWRGDRMRCSSCQASAVKYRSHWLVRELTFKPKRLPPIRRRKSLPGQMRLFDG